MYRSYTNRNFWTPSLEEADNEWLMRKLGTRIVIVDYDCLADEDHFLDASEVDALFEFEQFTDWPIIVFASWDRRHGARDLAETVGFKCVIDRWRHPEEKLGLKATDAWWISFSWLLCRFWEPQAAKQTLIVSSHLSHIIAGLYEGVATLHVAPTKPSLHI